MTSGRKSQNERTLVRVWPATSTRLLWAALLIGGPVGALVAIALGVWQVAPVFSIPVVIGLRLVGWAEISEEQLFQRRLIGDSTSVRFSDVREVGLGMDLAKGEKKWWYPEVETSAGTSIKFVMLKSRSGKRTVATVEEIFAACMAHMPEVAGDPFTNVTTSEDGELEFFLSPGYDAYLREKADGVSHDDQIPEVSIASPVAPTVDVERQVPALARNPHVTYCQPERSTIPGEAAPEVFTPQELTERPKSKPLTAARDEFVERSGRDRRRAAVKNMPAVVIEHPVAASPRPVTSAVSGPGFTSLFRRAW